MANRVEATIGANGWSSIPRLFTAPWRRPCLSGSTCRAITDRKVGEEMKRGIPTITPRYMNDPEDAKAKTRKWSISKACPVIMVNFSPRMLTTGPGSNPSDTIRVTPTKERNIPISDGPQPNISEQYRKKTDWKPPSARLVSANDRARRTRRFFSKRIFRSGIGLSDAPLQSISACGRPTEVSRGRRGLTAALTTAIPNISQSKNRGPSLLNKAPPSRGPTARTKPTTAPYSPHILALAVSLVTLAVKSPIMARVTTNIKPTIEPTRFTSTRAQRRRNKRPRTMYSAIAARKIHCKTHFRPFASVNFPSTGLIRALITPALAPTTPLTSDARDELPPQASNNNWGSTGNPNAIGSIPIPVTTKTAINPPVVRSHSSPNVESTAVS
mmetsp:Transcript_5950/g.11720  ORF Transcript_5950/g.11720 Transcript_5950/m.11720 type:complete len:385 (-) Transcript_5950:34-1188(-)